MKKLISSILAGTLAVSILATSALAASGLSNFKKVQTYHDSQFTDVCGTEWYQPNVKASYEYALIKGKGTTFAPNDNMLICEAVALASRMHSIYKTGKADFVQGTPWFKVYYDYAIEEGIINNGMYTDTSAVATRQQMAQIFTSALPAEALNQINVVAYGAIPDVYDENTAVYTLYRAGILTGKTTDGKFLPSDNIKRCEVAAIVTRMADKNLRKHFTLTAPEVNEKEKEKLLNYSKLFREALKNATLYITTNEKTEASNYLDLAAFNAQEAANLAKNSRTYKGLYDNYDLAMLAILKAEDELTPVDTNSAEGYMNGALNLILENDEILNGK